MRLNRILKGCAIALATVGIALPHATAFGAGPEPASANTRSTRAADIALAPGGILQGQVVNAQGVPQPGVTVSVQQRGRSIAVTKTNEKGAFAASGLKGGNYLVAAPGAVGPVRAWTHNTAPPAASQGLLLVPQGETARGQLTAGSLLTNPGVLITAAFVGTIATVAIVENDDDDAS